MSIAPHLEVIHLSDLHFGENHRFQPRRAPTGDRPADDSHVTLLDKLKQDLENHYARKEPWARPEHFIVCITGDLTHTAQRSEFKQANTFIKNLAEIEIYGRKIGLDNIYCIPGNHDLEFDKPDIEVRWTEYEKFHNETFKSNIDRNKPQEFCFLSDRRGDLNSIVLGLNSAVFVEKNKPDSLRGRLGHRQLALLGDFVDQLKHDAYSSCIKICLVHHHPILIPQLVEEGKNYDAIYDAGFFLSKIRTAGFHVLLHGHKHFPAIFSEDINPLFATTKSAPIIIVAGGAVGSMSLPDAPMAANTYNLISIKVHGAAGQYRVQTTTRSLDIWDDVRNHEIPSRWKWKTLGVDERLHLGFDGSPDGQNSLRKPYSDDEHGKLERLRSEQYLESCGFFPIAEVRPSLSPRMHYEARVWLARHRSDHIPKKRPVRVVWFAGKKFETCEISDDPATLFAVKFHYHGPMLIQASIEFEDGAIARRYVYAQVPGTHGG